MEPKGKLATSNCLVKTFLPLKSITKEKNIPLLLVMHIAMSVWDASNCGSHFETMREKPEDGSYSVEERKHGKSLCS